jgi:hypothetical protein
VIGEDKAMHEEAKATCHEVNPPKQKKNEKKLDLHVCGGG